MPYPYQYFILNGPRIPWPRQADLLPSLQNSPQSEMCSRHAEYAPKGTGHIRNDGLAHIVGYIGVPVHDHLIDIFKKCTVTSVELHLFTLKVRSYLAAGGHRF